VNTARIREHNLRTVLDVLRERQPVSRADLSLRSGLSKPTVGAALRAFEDRGLVREYGRTTGRPGRSASLYDLVPGSALVLGIDVGARSVRALLADLDGEPVDEHVLPLAESSAREVLGSMHDLRTRLEDALERTEIAVVGSPGVVDPMTGRIGSAPNIAGWEGVAAEAVLTEALGLPVRVENDVNLAALGEQARGAGAAVDSFAYLNIGSGLGAGIVLHGRLHRGARGAAGEVGFLPVGADPFAASHLAEGGAMEARLSRRGLEESAVQLADATAGALPPPYEIHALFEAARRGDALGRAVVSRAAREIAVCVASVTAVVDLELVLLGGSIGASNELLLPEVRAAIALLVPVPPRIERAQLGDRAVGIGAIAVGLDEARRSLIRGLVAAGASA
jgi:predicted NBD/HSP70 family sugar kinase